VVCAVPGVDAIVAGLGGGVPGKIPTGQGQTSLANQWGVRSLPTVKLFKDGRIVDEFMGAQPEAVIRVMLEQHLPRASDPLCEAARTALQNGDTAQALTLLQMALAGDPDYLPIKLELADVLIHSADLDGAEKLIKELPFQQQEEAAVKILAAQLAFARSAQFAASPVELKRRLAADPDDLASRYQLGALSAVKGDYADALAHFFDIMKRDRRFNDDIGKHSLLKVFDILGDENELVHHYRRKMASLLY
jgi:putative thioredoxin